MQKAMISQPMAGKTEEEIRETREKAVKMLEQQGYEVVDTFFTDEWASKDNMERNGVVNIPLCFLAKSLEYMSKCHAVYFCRNWDKTRGCLVEHQAALMYGLKTIYEKV